MFYRWLFLGLGTGHLVLCLACLVRVGPQPGCRLKRAAGRRDTVSITGSLVGIVFLWFTMPVRALACRRPSQAGFNVVRALACRRPSQAGRLQSPFAEAESDVVESAEVESDVRLSK